MDRILIYSFLILGLTPYLLMVFSPETIEPVFNYLKVGKRPVYSYTLGLFIVNTCTYLQMVKEATIQKLTLFQINIVKIGMLINLFIAPFIYLKLCRVDLTKDIYMYSVFYSLAIYGLISYVANKKT